MTATLATYIALPGTTAEAMQHWHDVLGGELQILRYGDMPLEGMPFEPDPQAVAHSTLVLPGGAGTIAGGDAMDPENDYPVQGTAYSLLYTIDTPRRRATSSTASSRAADRSGCRSSAPPGATGTARSSTATA